MPPGGVVPTAPRSRALARVALSVGLRKAQDPGV